MLPPQQKPTIPTEEVAAGRFREDLFYRLSVVRLKLPALKDRPDDIPLLAEHFLSTHPANQQPGGGLRLKSMSPEVADALLQYEWPGNVRELLNTIERDGYILRAAYNERRKLSSWLKITWLAVLVAFRHIIHQGRGG